MNDCKKSMVGFFTSGGIDTHAEDSVSPHRWHATYKQLSMGSRILVDRMYVEIQSFDSAKLTNANFLDSFLVSGWGSTFLLAGYTIEVGLKAIYFSEATRDPSDTKYQTHNLNDLAAIAGVSLSKSEADLCEFLSKYIVWLGRYPVPKKPEDMISGGGHGEHTLDVFCLFNDRIASLLSSKVKPVREARVG
ncbi:hypothetical protein [Luteimonas panaciterrae]|uniref:hypothetical protein n=1 Tax=Luteimonas panaciterrae TaxID=363885 RepID=UPI001CFC1646|nr:hypothetical protein [Luteimonas panaciterrae]